MAAFPDLASLSDAELKQLIEDLEREENEISFERRKLHGRIEILRGGEVPVGELDDEQLRKLLASILTGKSAGDRELPEETRREVEQLEQEEREISQRRRALHRRIDLLRTELVARLHRSGGETVLSDVDVSRLGEILARKSAPSDEREI